MRILHSRLPLVLTIPLALHPLGRAQVREFGTGAPAPVRAPHVTAELISDSGTVAPQGMTRGALSLMLEPGWHVYWVYAEIRASFRRWLGRSHRGLASGRCNILRRQDSLSGP